ncbi:MAG: single-stranded DNA-binding protein [Oscillospiraceae bacterium]|nr:single-stranded DNA-binding protein [Oscillospiraceae bacterium]
MNWILLRGTAAKTVEFSHTSHDTDFYTLWLEVPRLSGRIDTLRTLIGSDVVEKLDVSPGMWIEVQGQLRSFNNKSGSGSRLVVSALAKTVLSGINEPVNRVLLSGTICREPIYRRTPLGREICDIMLAVGRSYNRTDYLPLIAWGKTARECATLGVGSMIYLEGRFQSRQYTKLVEECLEEKTAYEISVLHTADSEEELILGQKIHDDEDGCQKNPN